MKQYRPCNYCGHKPEKWRLTFIKTILLSGAYFFCRIYRYTGKESIKLSRNQLIMQALNNVSIKRNWNIKNTFFGEIGHAGTIFLEQDNAYNTLFWEWHEELNKLIKEAGLK
jgi:hypothetical protein